MNLISRLINEEALSTPRIISAFRKIKRDNFLPPEVQAASDSDEALSIGYGQTNSQPFTVAFMMEKLQPQSGDRILDVGCGSGWTTALAAEIVGKSGSVYGLEIIPELSDRARENISKYNFINSGLVKIFLKDGRLGLPELAPFDKIIVSAATEQVPEPLLQQLRNGGRMIIPVGNPSGIQKLVLIEKADSGELRQTHFPGFVFVPLI